MAVRPKIVLFDVVETLMSLEPLRDSFVAAGLTGVSVDLWFSRVIRDGMALTLTDDYAPFPDVAASALRTLSRGTLDDPGIAQILDSFGTLPAHPDAEPAMRLLAEAGVRVACLSNGALATTEAFLARTGLDRLVERVLTVADVRQWKPGGRIYPHALDQLGVTAANAALVAVHGFDVHGAARAGLTTGWASRLEGHYADVFAPADVSGGDLVEVAEGLLAL